MGARIAPPLMEATDASRLVCVVVVSYQEYSLTYSHCAFHNRGVVVHQPRPAARCWSVREVASARGLRGRLSTASLLCPERRSALHPHHRATIYVSPDHDLTKARGDAPSQGQITFLVVKAWRYERTKVVKVALSPDPIKSVKAPEAQAPTTSRK